MEVKELLVYALVGQFGYRSMEKCDVAWWIEEWWWSMLGNVLVVIVLMKEWFGFKFKTKVDDVRILEGVWVCGKGSLVLKRWSITFHPHKEQI